MRRGDGQLTDELLQPVAAVSTKHNRFNLHKQEPL